VHGWTTTPDTPAGRLPLPVAASGRRRVSVEMSEPVQTAVEEAVCLVESLVIKMECGSEK